MLIFKRLINNILSFSELRIYESAQQVVAISVWIV